MLPTVTIHGVVVAVGEIGVLIQGKSGAGKSNLAAAMIANWPFGQVRLVADDRVKITRHGQRLVAHPHPAIADMLELRGFGIKAVPSLESVVLRGCIELVEGLPQRLPTEEERQLKLLDITLPCLRLPGQQSTFSATVTLWPYFRDEMLGV